MARFNFIAPFLALLLCATAANAQPADRAANPNRVPDVKTDLHYIDTGFYNNAIALCNKILRSTPGRATIYYKLGRERYRADAGQAVISRRPDPGWMPRPDRFQALIV